MAPQPPLVIIVPFAWERSTVTQLALNQLVTAGQLAANEDVRPAEWIVPPARDFEVVNSPEIPAILCLPTPNLQNPAF
jgi:hypothetical protein